MPLHETNKPATATMYPNRFNIFFKLQRYKKNGKVYTFFVEIDTKRVFFRTNSPFLHKNWTKCRCLVSKMGLPNRPTR